MKFFKKFLFLLIGLILSLNAVSAEEKKSLDLPPILVESSADKADITIGDIIKYSFKVTYDSSVKVNMPSVGVNLGEFEIKDYKEFDPDHIKERIIVKTEYLITTFTTGDYIIPPVTVEYTERNGTPKKIQSEKIFLRVHKTPSKISDKEDIRGLKPVIELKISYLKYIVFLILVIILICIAGFFYYKKKNTVPDKILNSGPKEPPHEIAIRELSELKNKNLPDAEKFKEFFTIISEILRKYIYGRYDILASDRTTEEILLELKAAKIKWDIVNIFKEILEFCDIVKFAKFIPKKEECERIFILTENLINTTKEIHIEV